MMAPVTAAPTPPQSPPTQKAGAPPTSDADGSGADAQTVGDGEMAGGGAQKQAGAFADLFAQDQAPVAARQADPSAPGTADGRAVVAPPVPQPAAQVSPTTGAPFQQGPEGGAKPASRTAEPSIPHPKAAPDVAVQHKEGAPPAGPVPQNPPLAKGPFPAPAEAARPTSPAAPDAPPAVVKGAGPAAQPPTGQAAPVAARTEVKVPAAAPVTARNAVMTGEVPPAGEKPEPANPVVPKAASDHPAPTVEPPRVIAAPGRPQPAATPSATTQPTGLDAAEDAKAPPPDREGPVRVAPLTRTEFQTAGPAPLPPPVATTAAALPGASPAIDGDALQSVTGPRPGDAPAPTTALQRSGAPLHAAALPAATGREAVSVAQQIATSVIRASGDRVEVRLDPPELGRVALSFQIREDLVIAHVSADKSETSDLLRRNGDDLQRALKEGGFGDVELDFSGGGEAQEGQTRAKTGAENTARTESQPILARAAKTGALDLRI